MTFLERLTEAARTTGSSQLMLSRLKALGITSPENELCQMAGYDQLGQVQCQNCPFGPSPAGCMDFFGPALRKVTKRAVSSAKRDLEVAIFLLQQYEESTRAVADEE